MEKKEYIEKLNEFVAEKGITIYEYYYAYALTVRSNKNFVLPEFELNNPFLTATDIKLLLESKEDRIEEYYAYTMSRVIELNVELLKQQLTRTDIEEAINEELDSHLTREDIEEAINEELDSQLTRADIEEAVNEGLDAQSTRENVEEPQEELNTSLTREDIEEAVNEELDSRLTRTDIEDIIKGELEKKSPIKVVITSIGRKIADLLNGFAVIREEKTGRAHLYFHDATSDSLKGEKVILNNKLEASSGYYVNYQEYVDQMLDQIVEQNPEEIVFVRDDNVERTLPEVLEEAFAILRKNGAIRFGKDLIGKDIKTYQDLLDLQLSGKEDFAGEELKTGIYVRRDILTRIFAKYKMKYRIYQSEENKENHL